MRNITVFWIAIGFLLLGILTLVGRADDVTPVAFVTNTPVVQETPVPATLVPTLIPMAAPASAATQIPYDRITTLTVIGQYVNVRAEPNTEATILEEAYQGSNFPITNQQMMPDGLWYAVLLDDGQTGWIFGSLARPVVIWHPVVKTFDGVEMVLVPPGCFMMGSENGEKDESPVNLQCFDKPFWIDRYEVTNAQYDSVGYWDGDDHPRENVSWHEAQAFCASRDARLPTEAEWEYAARGPYAFVYPWGNDFIDENAVSSWQNTARKTEAVGSRPDGASWVGALDMSGNVWEWTSSLYAEYPYDPADGREATDDDSAARVVRGGSCCSYVIADVRAAYRFLVDPYMQDPNVGFRCVRSD